VIGPWPRDVVVWLNYKEFGNFGLAVGSLAFFCQYFRTFIVCFQIWQ